jgi:transcriptional regulator with XRE-family HTH domain
MSKYGRLVKRLVNSVDYWAQDAMRHFVLEIDRRLSEQNMSRAALADKIGASPAYVTKIMRGDVNFTLRTMAKLSLAVGGRLRIEVVDRDGNSLRVTESNLCQFESYREAATKSSQTETIELDPRKVSSYDPVLVVRQAA